MRGGAQLAFVQQITLAGMDIELHEADQARHRMQKALTAAYGDRVTTELRSAHTAALRAERWQTNAIETAILKTAKGAAEQVYHAHPGVAGFLCWLLLAEWPHPSALVAAPEKRSELVSLRTANRTRPPTQSTRYSLLRFRARAKVKGSKRVANPVLRASRLRSANRRQRRKKPVVTA